MILDRGALFMADTYVSIDPPAEEIAETTLMAAETMRRFGIEPKVALLSHSSFGSLETASAAKMRRALALIRAREPGLEVDGEMHADAALSAAIRARICRLAAHRRGEPSDLSRSRRRQHRVQPAQGGD